MINKDQLWQSVLAEMEVVLPRPSFLTWMSNTQILSIDEEAGEILVAVPNNFTREWLEKKYHKTILDIVQNLTDNKIRKIQYKVEATAPIQTAPIIDLKSIIVPQKEEKNDLGLNPRYTFENFVVGKSNELAYAAAQAVAEESGKRYNPLFIYGGVGLGKTHLLQAVGHAILRKEPKTKVIYTNAERFTNEFVNALRAKTVDKFKKKYRGASVLLVDDIQFIAGKEGTQEEFFHTFNDLYQKDRQIVITSDRLPRAIPALEERLVSRFTSGLIADISPPDLETRLAILKVKCQEKKYSLAPEILQYLATHIQRNVRELEGALSKIIAYHELNKITPTLDSVKQIVFSLSAQPKKSLVNIKDIINTVAEFYGVKVSDLLGTSRRKELVIPRQVAMYLMRSEIDASFPQIAHEMGGRDHTTAIHSYNKIKKEIAEEGRIKQEVDYIKERLYNI
ncbi:MAG: chromosomal replication initiator protein DnaA [Patescibacteria group bacterium]